MHTVVGFFSSQGAGATNSALAAVADQSQTVSANNRFIFPGNYQIRAGLGLSANLTAARVNAPSLRSLLLPQLYPGNVGATVTNPLEIADWDDAGPRIAANEEVTIEASNNSGVAVNVFGALWVHDRLTPVPPGPQYTLVATAAITLVAGSWVFSQLTFDQTLPAGWYSVAGMRASCPNGFLARLVFPGLTQFRPGVVCDNAYSNRQIRTPWTDGRAGLFGRFYSTAQPAVEVLGLVAGAQTVTCFIDLIKE